jgi:hypothetical protein
MTQCTIFFLFRETRIITEMPPIPNATAISVDISISAFIHLSIIAVAITRIRIVDFIAPLCLRISFDVLPPDARLSNAPK